MATLLRSGRSNESMLVAEGWTGERNRYACESCSPRDAAVQKKNGRGQFTPIDTHAAWSQKLEVNDRRAASNGSGNRSPSASRAALWPRNGTRMSTKFLKTR